MEKKDDEYILKEWDKYNREIQIKRELESKKPLFTKIKEYCFLKHFWIGLARKICMVAYLLGSLTLLVSVIEILDLPALKLGIKTYPKVTFHTWLRWQFPYILGASVFDLLGMVVGVPMMLFLGWLFFKLFDKPDGLGGFYEPG